MRATDLALNLRNPLAFYATLRNVFDHNPRTMNEIYLDAPKHWHGMTHGVLEKYWDKTDPDVLNGILALEAKTKLVNDFLLTEDRVSMAHGLESRVPLLDQDLMDYAFHLPSHFKYRRGTKKYLLKQVAKPWLPEFVIKKKKWGFSVNPYLLFQKQLKQFAEGELTPSRLKDLDVFSPQWVDQVLKAKPSPLLRWHYFNLWVMCGYSLWHRQFIEGVPHGR